MGASRSISTPDTLSSQLVLRARQEGCIFVFPKRVSRLRLDGFYQDNIAKLRHFANDNQLSAEAHRLKSLAGKTILSRVQDAIANLFGSVSIGPEQFPIELTIASHQSRLTAMRDESVGHIVRVEENKVSQSTLAKYFEAYSLLPADQRPFFVFEANDADSHLTEKFSQMPSSFSVVSFDAAGVLEELILSRRPCGSMVELVDQYSESAFCAIARLSHEELENLIPLDSEIVGRLAAWLFHLRASAFERGKFDTLPIAHEAMASLEEIRNSAFAQRNASLILTTKVFLNLWLLYCNQRSLDVFENSVAIAHALKDELVQAHCFRLINTVHPHGAFSDQCLRGAAKVFTDRGFYNFANYCLNNALVGRFYEEFSPTTEFLDLVDLSAANIPNFEGLSILTSNAGVAQLVAGHISKAISLFDSAAAMPAMPLHRFSAEVNSVVARYLEGEFPDRDKVLRLARALMLQIEPRYRYQIANLLLNLRLATARDREASAEIDEMLHGMKLLHDEQVVGEGSALKIAAARAGLAFGNLVEQPGVRGRFIMRYGFVPIFHHTWF
jgi:hypothetical protein